MRRIIAHIGGHKTGTTAFQGWLQQHREELLAAGYFVPVEGGTGNSAGLVKALYLADRPQRKVERFFAEAARHQSCDILLSAELLATLSGDDLKIVSAQFDRLADRKVAVLVVRDQIAQFNSGFAQLGKAMKLDGVTFNGFVEESIEKGRADWRCKVEEYEAEGFEVRVLPYNAEFKAKGSPRSILEVSDFRDLTTQFDWASIPRRNASMGAIALILIDQLLTSRTLDGSDQEKRSPQELRNFVINLASKRFADTPFNGFTPAERRRVLEHYREGNAWIAQRFFGAPWDEVLPPEPERSVSPQTIDDLPPEQAAAVRKATAKIAAKAQASGWL